MKALSTIISQQSTAIAIIAMALSGCASVVSTVSDGHPNRDRIPVPPGATAKLLTGDYRDTDLDGWIKVPRGAGAFRGNNGIAVLGDLTVGYIYTRPSPLLLGNFVYGGVPGAAVDMGFGGGWEAYSYPVRATFLAVRSDQPNK